MTTITIHEIAHRLGGEVSGEQVLAPAPGHSDVDRSMIVRLVDRPPWLLVHSFAGDDWRELRDYVIECLDLQPDEVLAWAERRAQTDAERIARAQRLWSESRNPRGTLVETYLASRAIRLPEDAPDRVLRFHPECPWRDDATGEVLRVPAMLAGMGNLTSRELTAVHRTRLSTAGEKLGRKILGVAKGAVIPLQSLEASPRLVIGEGIETCLSGSRFGFRPVWAVRSAGAIRDLPVLHGITELVVLAEADDASAAAIAGLTPAPSDARPRSKASPAPAVPKRRKPNECWRQSVARASRTTPLQPCRSPSPKRKAIPEPTPRPICSRRPQRRAVPQPHRQPLSRASPCSPR